MSKTIINWTNYEIYLCLEEKKRLIHRDGVSLDCVYGTSNNYFTSTVQFGNYTLVCSRAVLDLLDYYWHEWFIDLYLLKNHRMYDNCDYMVANWIRNDLLECAGDYLCVR